MSRSDWNLERAGACSPSILSFKQAEIDEGTSLTYDDTVYIESSTISTVHYLYSGKFKYGGFVYSASGASVTFFLPDLQVGYLMQGKNKEEKNLSTTHNPYAGSDGFKYVTVSFPAGVTYFSIEVADPCAADCFFPPTAVTLDSTFLFNSGALESLGHDLDIVQGAGNLNITNASRMSICPRFILANKDSLIMGLECAPERRWVVNEDGTKQELPNDSLRYICNRNDLLKDRAVNKTRNTIIVNDQAGLVLDSGSVTHIGTNSTILIMPGGTLLIKAGATVIIGDSVCEKNRGELLADHGSYVCIEEGARLFFYNYIDSLNFYYKDTLDRHIVYIAMPDGMGHNGAIAGKNPAGGRGQFSPGGNGKWLSGSCLAFCDLVSKNPPYGINNRPFGWFNIGMPRALYTSPDTLCIGKPFVIDATPSLNETGYSITVCKYDTGSRTCILSIDSIVDNGDNCLAERYLFTPSQAGYYRVRLIVKNECNLTDTFSKVLYVPYLPVAVFTAPDSICPGEGVLHANGALSISNISKCVHRWTVDPLYDDSTDISALEGENLISQSWDIDSLTGVSSDFTFPGYNFAGGMRYLVSLKIKGWCSDSVFTTEVAVPLKVKINLELATSYKNPVGPTPVRLIGTVLNAQSWNWNPTKYLDSSLSLTPVATPTEPYVYILTGTLNGCTLSDTVTINYNEMVNAGLDQEACQGKASILGTDFNAAIFLGTYNYLNPTDFATLYGSYTGLDFLTYFTTYMIKVQKAVYTANDCVKSFKDLNEYRAEVFSKPWFESFYSAFVNGEADQVSLDRFRDSLLADASLRKKLDDLVWDHTSLDDLFLGFHLYMDNTLYESTTVIWEYQDSSDGPWEALPDWDNNFNAMVGPSSTTRYRITAIDDDLTIMEYDEAIINVDSVIELSFEDLYQEDSTVYFIDGTTPYSAYYRYLWVFGDGDSSMVRNPVHTFPAFDSAYFVCMNVTNACGTYQYCDTVSVDSLGLINGFGKTDLLQRPDVPETSSPASKKEKTNLDNGEAQLDNIPNPFNSETLISYSFGTAFTKANLRITDVLGRTIREIPVHYPRGKVSYDAGAQKGGIYYVSLIVDGVIIKSKTMFVDK